MRNNNAATILVVDDDKATRNLLSGILNEYGVITAESGEIALELLRKNAIIPHLILLDIKMDGLDGYEVCKRIKAVERTRDIPVIFLTVKSEPEEEALGLKMGAVDYIIKPINGLIVKARVQTHLELREHQLKEQKEIEEIKCDLRNARLLQQNMLPQELPEFQNKSNFDIFAQMVPAKEVGGDFYDFFPINSESLAFVIGDVSGKGVRAALFMAVCLTFLRSENIKIKNPGKCLSSLHNHLIPLCALNMSVTIFYGILNVNTGEVEYACGGHNIPYLLSPNGKIKKIPDVNGLLLGQLEPKEEFKVGNMQLRKGETIFLYTDGVTDAINKDGEMFEEEKLIEYLKKNVLKRPEDLTEGIFKKIGDYTSGESQSDDITIMALRYK